MKIERKKICHLIIAFIMIGLLAAPRLATRVKAGSTNSSQIPGQTLPKTLPFVKLVSVSPLNLAGTSPANPTGGNEWSGWLELSGPAPCSPNPCGQAPNGQVVGGMSIAMSSSNPAVARVQRFVQVPVGKTVQAFTLITSAVAVPTSVVISASGDEKHTQSATLTVVPPVLTQITLDQARVTSGGIAHGIAVFSGPPASASSIVLNLASSNTKVATVPSSVPLATGTTQISFPIQTLGVGADTSVLISGSYGGKAISLPALTVAPAALNEIKNDYPCCDRPFSVKLNGLAPPEGAIIQISNSNPAQVSIPAVATVPAGQDHVSLNPSVVYGNSDTTVRVSFLYKGVTKAYSIFVWHLIKPDLVIKSVSLYDRFGNAITSPPDGQPFKMCVTVLTTPTPDQFNSRPNVAIPPTAVKVSYLAETGLGTQAGHEFEIKLEFNSATNPYEVSVCNELPGLAVGASYDVTLQVDPNNKVDERSENNNMYKTKIKR